MSEEGQRVSGGMKEEEGAEREGVVELTKLGIRDHCRRRRKGGLARVHSSGEAASALTQIEQRVMSERRSW